MKKRQDSLNELVAEYEGYFEGLNQKELTYMKGRLLEQINWYNCSAIQYKRYYCMFNTLSILLTCTLPCLTTLFVKNYLIAIVSTLSVLITTLMNAFDLHNRWTEYRMLCEILKSSLYQYLTNTGVFGNVSKGDKFNLLVELSENYMKKELKAWNAANLSKTKTIHVEKE